MNKLLILVTILSLTLAVALSVVLLRQTLVPEIPAAIELRGEARTWEVVNGQDCPESAIINK